MSHFSCWVDLTAAFARWIITETQELWFGPARPTEVQIYIWGPLKPQEGLLLTPSLGFRICIKSPACLGSSFPSWPHMTSVFRKTPSQIQVPLQKSSYTINWSSSIKVEIYCLEFLVEEFLKPHTTSSFSWKCVCYVHPISCCLKLLTCRIVLSQKTLSPDRMQTDQQHSMARSHGIFQMGMPLRFFSSLL